MVNFTHFQTFRKFLKNLLIGTKVFYYCTRLISIKTAIEELLTMKFLLNPSMIQMAHCYS